ncbi:MAG: hypothetical protein NTW78_09900 [Campylobacterales bacterium]|nr:hypothetical protein [Campylobacterales bacterium]
MQKLSHLMNPLNIPYAAQLEILRVTGDTLFMLSEEDFIEALEVEGEIMTLRLSEYDLQQENENNQSIKGYVINSQSILIVFESLDEVVSKENELFMDYIYENTKDDTTVKFGLLIVPRLSEVPISLLLTGYKENEDIKLSCGNNYIFFWTEQQTYCMQQFKEMRERISKKVDVDVKSIRLLSDSYNSKNMVQAFDVKNDMALKAFEFNHSTKEEFNIFIEKLENLLIDFYSSSVDLRD